MTPDPKTADQGNVRDSAEGVEDEVVTTEGEPATGLIGNGQMVDPRYIGQR
jgi:hypothetical protein